MQQMTTEPPDRDAVVGLSVEQLDALPWPVLRVGRDGLIRYGNRALCDLLRMERVAGQSLEALFTAEDLATVRAHLESRFESGVSDTYQVTARRADGVRVPLLCSATPERDAAGRVIGSIAVVQDLLAEDVWSRVYDAMQNLSDRESILRETARQCARLVPFDAFAVTLYSVGGEHARQFFLDPPAPYRPSVRWYPMTAYAKALVDEKRVLNVPDIEQWLEQPQWRQYRDEADTQAALRMGWRSSLSFPVVVANRVVATAGFARLRDKPPFSALEQKLLNDLPLRAAVRAALHHDEVAELEFTLGLMRRIAAGPPDAEAVARTLVDELAAHYEWENVSVFRPDVPTGDLALVCQRARRPDLELPEGWRHPIDRGVTGHVYRTGRTMNVPDVTAPDVAAIYVQGQVAAGSELCLPVVVDGHVFWLLNLEDPKRNAFAQEEQAELESLLREVGVMLQLVSQTRLFGELLARSGDAVIQTDYAGRILDVNPATAQLLGYAAAEMVGRPLADFFCHAEQARHVMAAARVPNDEVQLRRSDGTPLSLLLSGTSLPPEIGRKVYIGNDLSTRKRLETIEILRQLFNEIASQIKTPLSLAFTWLDRLAGAGVRPQDAEVVDKVLRQLRKVDLGFDRLLLYERHGGIVPVERIVFDLPKVVAEIRAQMPPTDAARIEVRVEGEPPPVRGDMAQIWFCIETLMAYLLRFAGPDDALQLGIRLRGRLVELAIGGRAPRISGGDVANYAARRWAIRAITELALGEQTIRNIVAVHHGGEFHRLHDESDHVEYVIALPNALLENAP